MYCSNCGKEIQNGTAKFCLECGASLQTEEPAPKREDDAPGGSTRFQLRTAMLVICLICATACTLTVLIGGEWGWYSHWWNYFDYGEGLPYAAAFLIIAVITGVIGLCCKKDN